MNVSIIMGRITKDLELRQTTSGTSVLRFTVAVDRYSKDKENDTDFISCIAFGKNAEFIGKWFSRGQMIALEGSIKTGSYEKDGRKVYTTDIIVNHASFCGDRQTNGNAPQSGSENRGGSYQGNGQQTAQNANMNVSDMLGDFEDVISDDVPF